MNRFSLFFVKFQYFYWRQFETQIYQQEFFIGISYYRQGADFSGPAEALKNWLGRLYSVEIIVW